MNDDSRHLNVLPSSGRADALRADPPLAPPPDLTAGDAALPLETRLLKAKIIAAMRTVYDPELPVNIFDLGLIYDIRLDETNHAFIQMTLTSPGCPVAGTLPAEIQKKVEAVPGVSDSTIQLVWDPPWDKSRMSEEARLELNL